MKGWIFATSSKMTIKAWLFPMKLPTVFSTTEKSFVASSSSAVNVNKHRSSALMKMNVDTQLTEVHSWIRLVGFGHIPKHRRHRSEHDSSNFAFHHRNNVRFLVSSDLTLHALLYHANSGWLQLATEYTYRCTAAYFRRAKNHSACL